MNRYARPVSIASSIAFLLPLAACTQVHTTAPSQSVADFEEVSTLYHKVTAPQRLAMRKPVRDERDRNLKILASKAGQIIDETRTWDTDARLTSAAPQHRDAARQATGDMRASLENLR